MNQNDWRCLVQDLCYRGKVEYLVMLILDLMVLAVFKFRFNEKVYYFVKLFNWANILKKAARMVMHFYGTLLTYFLIHFRLIFPKYHGFH